MRLVPGVEHFFLVPLFGLVEQASADPLDEAAREQRPSRPPRSGEDRGLDRPQAPLAEVLESFAVGLRNDEPRVALALRPVEWKRDLVGTLLHSLPVFGGAPG